MSVTMVAMTVVMLPTVKTPLDHSTAAVSLDTFVIRLISSVIEIEIVNIGKILHFFRQPTLVYNAQKELAQYPEILIARMVDNS